jgi:hypothetical protein
MIIPSGVFVAGNEARATAVVGSERVMSGTPKRPAAEDQSVDIPIDFDDAPAVVPRASTAPGAVAVDFFAETKKGSSDEMLSRAMYERFLESDYPGALTLAETALELNPDNQMAAAVIQKCRTVRESHRTDRSSITVGMILALTIPPSHLRLLPLDPKFVFLLSRLDGTLDLGSVLDACGQSLEEVSERLADLLWRQMLTECERPPPSMRPRTL